MKIDIFTHILPQRYWDALCNKAPNFLQRPMVEANPGLRDLELRFRIMDEYDSLVQVLTITAPPLEAVVGPEDTAELARIANDDMAELVARHPDRFVAAVASLPMNDMDAALEETDRAIKELGFKGVQIFTSINGEPLDSPKFLPLYEKMAQYDLPIWLHPKREPSVPDYPTENRARYLAYQIFGWPYETTIAMTRLVLSGVLERYPSLKVITHHCGGMVPYFYPRITNAYDFGETLLGTKYKKGLAKAPLEYFPSFYADTALNGNPAGLMCGYAFFGADHLLFGTDMPYDSEQGRRSVRDTIKAVQEMDIPDSDRKKIYEENARQVLRLSV